MTTTGAHVSANTTQWLEFEHNFAAYLDGDGAAAGRLFGGLSHILKSYFFVRTRSEADAQDLAQITLLKIHMSRARFDPALSLKTWVFVVAQRTLIDHWRKAGRQEPVHSVPDIDATTGNYEGDSGSDTFDLMSKKKMLGQALQILKPEDRSIVFLSVDEGLSMAEIALVFATSEGAVKLRMHRARKALRQWFETRESPAPSMEPGAQE